MKKTFLYLLFKNDRHLFVLVLLLLVGQLFFTYKGVETVPFFNYGMYSSPTPPKKAASFLRIYVQDKMIPLEEINFRSRPFIRYQLDYCQRLIAYDSIDPVRNTIRQRFGQQAYLEEKLTNDTAAINKVVPWLADYTSLPNLSLRQESYIFVDGRYQRKTE